MTNKQKSLTATELSLNSVFSGEKDIKDLTQDDIGALAQLEVMRNVRDELGDDRNIDTYDADY